MATCRWLAITSCVLAAAALHLRSRGEAESEDEDEVKCPSMFVAIMTRPGDLQQRNDIRDMWRHAGQDWGDVKAKFVICSLPEVSTEIKLEQLENMDMEYLDCEEGYQNGYLTRKVSAAMQRYLDEYSDYQLFMKVDDDTFVSTRRICNLLSWRESQGKDHMRVYMGVFAEGDREALFAKHFPNRDPSSQWYEPFEKYNSEVYPVSAKGGPGYILGRPLVENIMYRGIAETNELNNEDKAMGLWIDKLLKQEIMPVDFVNVPGTDGYSEHARSIVTTGTYSKYPHFLHHHLQGSAINCLFHVDHSHDPEARIDSCFAL